MTGQNNRPVRAKSRIVVLGDLEEQEWARLECCSHVLCQDSLQELLVSLAIQKRRVLKQGDCKNALCQATLLDDELVIVMPPPGCLISPIGSTYCCKLRKMLYGLRRSPLHWFNNFRGHLTWTWRSDNVSMTPVSLSASILTFQLPLSIWDAMWTTSCIILPTTQFPVEQKWFETGDGPRSAPWALLSTGS